MSENEQVDRGRGQELPVLLGHRLARLEHPVEGQPVTRPVPSIQATPARQWAELFARVADTGAVLRATVEYEDLLRNLDSPDAAGPSPETVANLLRGSAKSRTLTVDTDMQGYATTPLGEPGIDLCRTRLSPH